MACSAGWTSCTATGRVFRSARLAGLLDWLGNPEIEVRADRVVLKGASHPDYGAMDISIPLSSDGKFLINWPRKLFEESFRQVSFYAVISYRRLERDLASQSAAHGPGRLPRLHRIRRLPPRDVPLHPGPGAGLALRAAELTSLEDYRKAREQFLEDTGAFLRATGDASLKAPSPWRR